MSSFSARKIQDLITNLNKDQAGAIGAIDQLFTNFGVNRKQDIRDQTKQLQAQAGQSRITRGLTNTTIADAATQGIARQGQRELSRVDEDVAVQRAGFQERRLIDPNTILGLIQQASSVDQTPQQVFVPPTSAQVNAPGFGVRPAGQGGTSFGGTTGTGPQPQGTATPGAPAQGARIVTRGGTFTPQQFLNRGAVPTDEGGSIGGAARGAAPKASPENKLRARIISR